MRLVLVSAASFGVLLAAAVTASAQVQMSTAVEPAVLAYPQQRVLTYRLTMTTGEREERLSVSPQHIPFARPGPLTLEGPGTLQRLPIHGDPAPPGPGCPRIRTPSLPTYYYTVVLPPRSTSVLVSPYRLIAAPWRGTDLRLLYDFTTFDPATHKFVGPPALRSPQPVLTGVSGVRITLTVRPISTFARPLRLGRAVLVHGRTQPAVGGDRIVLRALSYTRDPRVFTVAIVKVRGDGRFSFRWRPRQRGSYDLYAIYRSQRPQLSNDSTPCNEYIRVR